MKHRACLLLLFLSVIGSTCFSQSNDESLALMQFNFFNPGGKSLAMGGAFLGLADDSTAALANPAGLTALIRPEFTAEFASTDFTNTIPWDRGYLTGKFGPPNNHVSQSTGFQTHYTGADFPARVNHLSFASVVYPVVSTKFVLSGFYNEQTKFNRDATLTQVNDTDPSISGGFFVCKEGTTPGNGCKQNIHPYPDFDTVSGRFSPTDLATTMTLRSVGASASLRPGSRLSLGLTVTYYDLKLCSDTQRGIGSVENQDICSPALSGQDLSAQPYDNRFQASFKDSNVSYAFGALIGKSDDPVSFGVTYVHRPKFSGVSVFSRPGFNSKHPGFDDISKQDVAIRFPDSFGIGLATKPHDRWAIAFDVNRIFYSQLMDNYYNARYRQDFVDNAIQHGTPVNQLYAQDFQKSTLKVDDGNEYRFGVEYNHHAGSGAIAFRGGYWHEPFHSVVYTLPDSSVTESVSSEFVNDPDFVPPPEDPKAKQSLVGSLPGWVGDTRITPFWFQSLKDQFHSNHFTGGMGYVASRYRFDIAYDYSKNFSRFVASTTVYLGKRIQ